MQRIGPLERRALLVQAALRVIAVDGVTAATTRAVVAEAGMSLASFHYAFRSRDEMMRELVAYVVSAESTAVVAVPQSGDIRATLRAGMQAYLDYVIADPAHEQVMQEILHYALRTPGLRHLAHEQYENYWRSVTHLLEGAASACAIRWIMPIDELARLAVTVTDGVTLAYLADRDASAAGHVLDWAADSLAALARPSDGVEPGIRADRNALTSAAAGSRGAP